MKHKSIQKIILEEEKNNYVMLLWTVIQDILLTAGGILTLFKLFKETAWSWPAVVVMAVLTFACLCGSFLFKARFKYILCINALPWLGLVIWNGVASYWQGMLGWLNMMISAWNQMHESSVALFNVIVVTDDLVAFSMLLTVFCITFGWWIARNRHCFIAGIYALIWTVVQLSGGYYDGVACAILFMAVVSIAFSEKMHMPTRRQFVWTGIIIVCLGLMSVFQGQMDSMKEVHDQTLEGIHTWRYGKHYLPEGDMRQAYKLLESDDEMLVVQTEQEKTLYLKGYTGGRYVDGIWKTLPDSAYGDVYEGMFKWLEKQEFNPETQVALYYALSDSESAPELNHLNISVVNAEREYAYMPASLAEIVDGRIESVRDEGIFSKGLIGEKQYVFSEISDVKPSELTMTEGWVQQPETKAQEQYVQTEAVYRNFVYDTYLTVDAAVYDDIWSMFWSDYESETDGIYSAVSRVRQVLAQNTYYTQYPEAAPADEDAILWFLNTSHAGNSVMYASAAVEALRVHGIPARYAEGYYISQKMIADSAGEIVHVDGHQAHAWVEVYFDGIGWMPIDVTPGYYYDAKTLQNMVSTPDTVHKTAALQDSDNQAQQMLDSGSGKNHQTQLPVIILKNVAMILLGVAAVLVILITAAFIVLECLQHVRLWKEQRFYEKATDDACIHMMEYWVFYMLGFWGIESVLGWHTEEVDAKVCARLKNIEAGEYTRICKLLEKMVYGGIMPEAYEKRTIENFLEKLASPEHAESVFKKIQLHYIIIWAAFFLKKEKALKKKHRKTGFFKCFRIWKQNVKIGK